MTHVALDPYGLLGVSIESTPSEVKKAYYALSLVAHPDKGGTAADMMTVHNAYRYVTEQVTSVNRTQTVEGLEEGFAEYCRVQTEEPPRFRDIAKDAGENERFHGAFLGSFLFDGDTAGASSPPVIMGVDEAEAEPAGYGRMMERSAYADLDPLSDQPFEYDPVVQADEHVVAGGDALPVGPHRPFRMSIMPYTEPQGLDGRDRRPGYDYRQAYNTTPEVLPSDLPQFRRTLSSLLRERADTVLTALRDYAGNPNKQ